jgi:hypothetical protein
MVAAPSAVPVTTGSHLATYTCAVGISICSNRQPMPQASMTIIEHRMRDDPSLQFTPLLSLAIPIAHPYRCRTRAGASTHDIGDVHVCKFEMRLSSASKRIRRFSADFTERTADFAISCVTAGHEPTS